MRLPLLLTGFGNCNLRLSILKSTSLSTVSMLINPTFHYRFDYPNVLMSGQKINTYKLGIDNKFHNFQGIESKRHFAERPLSVPGSLLPISSFFVRSIPRFGFPELMFIIYVIYYIKFYLISIYYLYLLI